MSAARRHEGVYILFQRRVVYIEVAPDRYAVFKIVRPEVGVESAALVYQCTDFSEGFADGLDLVESALTFEDWAYELVAAVYRSVGYYFPVAARRGFLLWCVHTLYSRLKSSLSGRFFSFFFAA